MKARESLADWLGRETLPGPGDRVFVPAWLKAAYGLSVDPVCTGPVRGALKAARDAGGLLALAEQEASRLGLKPPARPVDIHHGAVGVVRVPVSAFRDKPVLAICWRPYAGRLPCWAVRTVDGVAILRVDALKAWCVEG